MLINFSSVRQLGARCVSYAPSPVARESATQATGAFLLSDAD